MRKSVLFLLPSLALAACQTTGQSIAVHQPGDGNLSCEQLAGEIAQMDQIVGDAVASQNQADATRTGIHVAQNAAVYSGVAGSVGGGAVAGLVQAGSLFSGAMGMNEQQTAQNKENATMRRTSLMGVYQGKGC